MGKWKLIIMILFILNDYLKPPKAQRNLSIRHSGLCKGTQSKTPRNEKIKQTYRETKGGGEELSRTTCHECTWGRGRAWRSHDQFWLEGYGLNTRVRKAYNWGSISVFRCAANTVTHWWLPGELVALPRSPRGKSEAVSLFPAAGGRRCLLDLIFYLTRTRLS